MKSLIIGCVLLFTSATYAILELPEYQAEEGWIKSSNIVSGRADAVQTWGAGTQRKVFFDEFLPAVMKRKLLLDQMDDAMTVQWLFTGQHGGLTIDIRNDNLKAIERHYDSVGFGMGARHPEKRHETLIEFDGQLKSVTVELDEKAGLTIYANGKPVHNQVWLVDLQRHQLFIRHSDATFRARLLEPETIKTQVAVDPSTTFQTMEGFGGITAMPTYHMLSDKGKELWWHILCEYNLLIQREYPMGVHMKQDLSNMDKLEDAVPHYYGDNFPNSEVSDFEYLRTLRQIPGSMVWYEFWALPSWMHNDAQQYAQAMLHYCERSKQETSKAPEVVGVQNEILMGNWKEMILELRQALDENGFEHVRIHSNNASRLEDGLKWIELYRQAPEQWEVLDYTASNMYDFQDFFTRPDEFDSRLLRMRELSEGKIFLSPEMSVNCNNYQYGSYRMALQMAQLFHKNLVLADAAALGYCWLLLDVEQPSYGWTRSLMVPDRDNGFIPAPSSFKLRTFGAYSRRIRQNMKRIDVQTDNPDLMVSAFSGKDMNTIVLLNRSSHPFKIELTDWQVEFRYAELADPYHPNHIMETVPQTDSILVAPGSLLTLSDVPLITLPENFEF